MHINDMCREYCICQVNSETTNSKVPIGQIQHLVQKIVWTKAACATSGLTSEWTPPARDIFAFTIQKETQLLSLLNYVAIYSTVLRLDFHFIFVAQEMLLNLVANFHGTVVP